MPVRNSLSHLVGWLADRRLPGVLRAPVYRAYARQFRVDLAEMRDPLASHPTFTDFFVRHLKPGARVIDAHPASLVSPVDGTVQTLGPVERGHILQAKGRPYALEELLGDAARGVPLDGGFAWTIYLSPRDYHRIHSPVDAKLTRVEWLPGERYSVAPKVLERRAVLSINERAVLTLESERCTLFLVLVGALNVGRMKVVGVEQPRTGPVATALAFARGAELARFEMGSTIVLVAPPGCVVAHTELAPGDAVKLGRALGRFEERRVRAAPSA